MWHALSFYFIAYFEVDEPFSLVTASPGRQNHRHDRRPMARDPGREVVGHSRGIPRNGLQALKQRPSLTCWFGTSLGVDEGPLRSTNALWTV